MNKTQASRLLTLAYFLRTEVDEKNFSLDLYISDGRLLTQRKLDCGTTACDLGWCTAIFPDRFKFANCGQLRGIMNDSRCTIPIDFDGEFVCDFFGITEDEAYFLFSPYLRGLFGYAPNYRTPIEEAREIETIVGNYGWKYAVPLTKRKAKRKKVTL